MWASANMRYDPSHIWKMWDDLYDIEVDKSSRDHEALAKRVELHSNPEMDRVAVSRCRQVLSNSAVEEGLVTRSTSIEAMIDRVRSGVVSSRPLAKYTDEYPDLSVWKLRESLSCYNKQEFSEWLHDSDIILTKSKKIFIEGEGYVWERIPVIRPEVESVYRLLVDLCTVMVLYGYQVPRDELLRRLTHVHLQWCRMLKTLDFNFIKLAKYKLAAFAAYAKHSRTMPKSPFTEEFLSRNAFGRPSLIFDGEFRKFFNSLKEETTGERLYYMSFVDSICRGLKKGSDRPTDAQVHQSNLDTLQCFTDEREPILELKVPINHPDEDRSWRPDAHWEETVDLTFECLRTVDEIVPPNTKSFSPTWHRMPSLSACYENKFEEGGSMTRVRNELGIIFPEGIPLQQTYESVRQGMFKEPVGKPTALDNSERPVFEAFKPDGSFNQAGQYAEFSSNYDNLADPVDIDQFIKMLYQVRTECEDGEFGGPGGRKSRMTLIGLKEALKIRGITKGEGLENWLLQPLQKFLAAQLLKFPCFKVTGTPLKAEYLTSLLTRIEKGESFLSGDYDNATNKMYVHYTRQVIRRICQNLDLSPEYSLIAEQSLCDNIAVYRYIDPVTRKLVVRHGHQKNAQPMGKILSFVTLCIINAAVCRKAVEIDALPFRKFVPLKRFEGLINGDDCCFKLVHFSSWEKVSRCVGLENSIGKTFFSPDFIEMNSRSFVIDVNHPEYGILSDGCRFGLHFLETPFVNFGLLKGFVRSSSVKLDDIRFERICSLGECHTDLVKENYHFYTELDFLFKRFNRDLLEDPLLSAIPYYVPKWLGGLGLDAGPVPSEKISHTQRVQASLIYENIEIDRPKHVTGNKTCLIHEEVQRLQDELLTKYGLTKTQHTVVELETGEEVSLAIENQRVYTMLAERAWKSLRLDQIKTDIEDKKPFEITPQLAKLEVIYSQKIESKSVRQLLLSKKEIHRRLKFNRSIWSKSFNLALGQPNRQPLPWRKFWHQKQKGYLPIVVACAVRDMKHRVLEY